MNNTQKTMKRTIVLLISFVTLTAALMAQMFYMYFTENRAQEIELPSEPTYIVDTTEDIVTENIIENNVSVLHQEIIVQEEIVESEVEIIEPVEPATDINSYDYNYVLRVVAAESMGEPLEGQMAVAQCIRETALATGMTPEQVVKAPNQYTSPISLDAVSESVREACERVLINGESVTEEPIRYFYSIVGGFVSSWHENSLTYVITIGNHKFFKI